MNRCKIVFSAALVVLSFLFSGMLYASEGVIEKVEFQKDDGRIESVIFHLNGHYLPKKFALKGDNPRVVFDFMETKLARSVSTEIKTQGHIIQKIRLGRHPNKTRVVVDLAAGGMFNFDQRFDENLNLLTIQFFPADFPEKEKVVAKDEPAAAIEKNKAEELKPVEPEVIVEEKISDEVVEEKQVIAEEEGPVIDPLLFDVHFENTSNKGEMVLFKLNGFYPPTVTGEEEGTPLVICEFAGTRLDEKVVTDQAIHGEFIEQVRVQQLKDSDLVRVTLELVPNKNYDLQQVFFKEDNLFVIIVNSYDSLDGTKE